MAGASASDPFELWRELTRAWTWPIMAPQQLSQAILPGWSLVTVNETNSAAPDTERAIVAKVSYGRQLGRLTDAVEALIAERPTSAKPNPAFDELRDLATQIKGAKRDAAAARLASAPADLAMLKTETPAAFEQQKAALLEAIEKLSRDGAD